MREENAGVRLPSVAEGAYPTVPLAMSEFAEPSLEEYRLYARIILWLSRQPRVDRMETAPPSLTQAGMASELGASLSSISSGLRRLTEGGALEEWRSHVRGRRLRVKVYQLTPEGQTLAEHLRNGMARSSLRPVSEPGERSNDP